VLKYSLAKTLAEKFKKSVASVFTKGEIIARYTTSKGEEKEVRFYRNRNWRIDRDAWSTRPGIDQTRLELRLRTRSKLGQACVICGEEDNVEMHHVRHLRRMDQKGQKDIGFTSVMIALNRKQLPLCSECHSKVHRGLYDGMKLTDLKYDLRK